MILALASKYRNFKQESFLSKIIRSTTQLSATSASAAGARASIITRYVLTISFSVAPIGPQILKVRLSPCLSSSPLYSDDKTLPLRTAFLDLSIND